jgi:ligand-binding sensor domain-containing protein
MKKIFFYSCFSKLLFFVFISGFLSIDLNAQAWQIFTPDYSYNSGKVSLDKIIRTKNIVDVVKTNDGTIWLACGDSYPVSVKFADEKNYEIGSADPGVMKEINYVPTSNSKFITSKDGIIWLVTSRNLLMLSNNGNWEGINVKDGTRTGNIKIPVPQFDILADLSIDNDGHLYVSGINSEQKKAGLARLDNDSWTYFMMPDEVVSKLMAKSSGKGLKLLAGKEMNYSENPLMRLTLNDICFDAKGNAWMSLGFYKDEGLIKFSNGQYKLFNVENGNIQSDNISDIDIAKNGSVHLATAKGIIVIGEDDKLSSYEKDFVPFQMTFDSDNYLWWSGKMKEEKPQSFVTLASSQEKVETPVLYRYNTNEKSEFQFTIYNTPLSHEVTRIYVDDSGIKYFVVNGSATGLFILNDKIPEKYPQWKTYSLFKDGSQAMRYHFLTAGTNDKEWNFRGISHYGSTRYLVEYINGAWKQTGFKMTDEPTGLLSMPLDVSAITADLNNNLYLGTNNFIYKYDKLSNPVNGFDKSKLSKQVNCLSVDNDGVIWVGTSKGLAKYNGTEFSYFDKSNSSVPGKEILNLLTDSKNRTWVGTPNGLLCIDKDKSTVYDNKNGLKNERVVAMAENSSGKVFIAASNINKVCRYISYEENGSLKEEALPDLFRINRMSFDRNDNLWIACEGCLLCRKNSGEYIKYDNTNSPLQSLYNLNKMFIVGSEIWLVVDTFSEGSSIGSSGAPGQNAPASKETQILSSLKSRLGGLRPGYFVLVFTPESV